MTQSTAIDVFKPVNIPPKFLPEAIKTFPLGNKRIEVLDAVLDASNKDLKVAEICKKYGFSRDAYYNAFRDERFVKLLCDIREFLYPYQRSQLAEQILADALTPLKDAFRVEHGERGPEVIPYVSSLVKTRDQAAAILGLQLKQPDVNVNVGQTEVIHRFQQHSNEVLEEFASTGVWKDEWGAPPWVKKKS